MHGARLYAHLMLGVIMKIKSMAMLLMVCVSISCTSKPLESTVVGLPKEVAANQEVKFIVRVKNVSREAQILPTKYEVEFTTGVDYLENAEPGAYYSDLLKSSDLLHGDFAIITNTLHINPPMFDSLAPGEHIDYTIKWRPQSNDKGRGALRIAMPYSFPEIPFQEMGVSPK